MKTRMKKLISIGTIPVLALALLLVLGTALQAKKPAPSLTCTTEYFFVAGLEIFDDDGRLLCWEGPISGDINGVIQWWMMPGGPSTGQVGHHAGGRWQIWNSTKSVLLLAGDDEESTTVRHGKNSVWRGHGIVTDASEEFEDWIDRSMHEGGHFTWDESGLPEHGTGTFRIN